MKRNITLLLVLTVFIPVVNAQFNTNSKMVGASSSLDFGISSQKDDVSGEKTPMTRFDLNPRAGYFLRNRIALGGDIYLSYSSEKPEGYIDPITSTGWRLGPYGRYYYKTVSWFVPFGEAKTGFGGDKISYGEGSETKHNVFYFGLGAGASLFLADNFSLEALLMYQYEKAKNPEGGGSHTTNGVMVSFGFSFYFNSLLQDTGGTR